jgi:amphi-Trp domain-containing protein
MEQENADQLGWHMEGSAGELADILMEFARELRNGDVNVWKGQRELHLNPMGKLTLRVHARADDQREWLDMQLAWPVSTGEDALGGNQSS